MFTFFQKTGWLFLGFFIKTEIALNQNPKKVAFITLGMQGQYGGNRRNEAAFRESRI
jgi:hypothetical protein